MDKNYEIKNKKNNVVEILIYGNIVGHSNDWNEDSWSAKELNNELDKIDDINTLNIRINSGGGNVFAGLAIYNSIKRFSKDKDIEVKSYIDGIAASISSVIPLAADEVVMAKESFYMIHQPFVRAIGTAEDLREKADLLDDVSDTLRNTYDEKTNIARTDIKDMMDEETWLNSSDALDFGFVDRVEDYEVSASIKDDTLIMNSVEFDLSQFNNLPDIENNIEDDNDIEDDNFKGGKDMFKSFETEEDFENFKDELLTGYIKAEDVLDRFEELELDAENLDEIVNEVEEIKNDAEEANEKLNEIKRDNKFKNRKEKLEDVGVEVSEEDKEEILDMSEKALELLVESNKEKMENSNSKDKNGKNFLDLNTKESDEDEDSETAAGL